MDAQVLFETQAACIRVPPEVLHQIFVLLVPHQKTLNQCARTCRKWGRVAIPVLWKRPRFYHLADVEKFAATLMAPHNLMRGLEPHSSLAQQAISPYAKLVESLSFSTLPEHDRNNPHLAVLLDTIINCLVIVSTPPAYTGSSQQGVSGRSLLQMCTIKRARSLSRNGDMGVRPYSATGLPLGNTSGKDCAAVIKPAVGVALIQAQCSSEAAVVLQNGGVDATAAGAAVGAAATTNAGPQGLLPFLVPAAVDDTQLHYGHLSTPAAGQSPLLDYTLSNGNAINTRALAIRYANQPGAVYTTTLRQLDLRFCKGVRNYSLQKLAPKLKPLSVLNLAGGLRTDITIAKLSQHMSNLRRVSLAWTSNLTDFGVSELVQKCKSIEALDLTYCTQLKDMSMFAIAHSLHNLKALSVAYCAGVTDIGIREVAIRCTIIQVLNVAKCMNVSEILRRSLAEQRIATLCDSFEPFTISDSHSPKPFSLSEFTK
ncbi:hypothetical protein BX070DRAFT_231269 [Coemansia spiralis]|nr:hypothetical protein BX070DRAFT_231269 [Coemansia spiralis]